MPVTDEKQVLAGLVERVTFHNEENGFCVLRVKVRGQKDLITVLGQRIAISLGVEGGDSVMDENALPQQWAIRASLWAFFLLALRGADDLCKQREHVEVV